MRVTHVCFVGTRTEHFDETVSLFRDILGMPTGFEYPGLVRLQTQQRQS